jgi:hypothetical protein
VGDIDVERLLTYSRRRGIGVEMTILVYEVLKRMEAPLDELIKRVKEETFEEITQGATENG